MQNLPQQIADYVARRNESKQLEEDLVNKIRTAFNSEVKIINSRLPGGYLVESYHVIPYSESHGKPLVIPVVSSPNKMTQGDAASREVARFHELGSLSQQFIEQFENIERQYGFFVAYFIDKEERQIENDEVDVL